MSQSDKSSFRRLFVLAALLLLALPVWGVWWVSGGLDRGKKYLQSSQYQNARRELNRYLWIGSSNEALLSLAEAYARDSSIPANESAEKAIACLERIDGTSELAVEARLQEARLRFLILNQPCRSEQMLKQVLSDDPNSFEANYLMWKLLDLTRRYHLVEPYFTRCFELADESRQADLLHEWYYSQFSTYSAASQLDQMMGVVPTGKPSDTIVEHHRLKRFLEAEPDCALNHALMAEWYHEHGIEHEKWSSFDQAWEKASASTPPYAYAVFFDLLLDAGRFEEASQVIDSWPEPRAGYDYDKRVGICDAEIRDEPEPAIVACRKAIEVWPGPVDWQLHHRLAGLLTRVGKIEEAETARKEAKRLETLMEVDYHQKLRVILTAKDATADYLQISDFYRQLGREREAEAWRKLAENASAP